MTGGLLALDVATATGWAYGLPDARPQWGTFDASKRSAENGEILARFEGWIEGRLDEWQPAWVAFESPYVPRVAPTKVRVKGAVIATLPAPGVPLNAKVARRLYQLCGLVELACHRHAIEVREATASSITQAFTGFAGWRGRDNKKKATVRMCEHYGWQVNDDDQADALALWVYMESVFYPGSQRSAGPLFAQAR